MAEPDFADVRDGYKIAVKGHKKIAFIENPEFANADKKNPAFAALVFAPEKDEAVDPDHCIVILATSYLQGRETNAVFFKLGFGAWINKVDVIAGHNACGEEGTWSKPTKFFPFSFNDSGNFVIDVISFSSENMKAFFDQYHLGEATLSGRGRQFPLEGLHS